VPICEPTLKKRGIYVGTSGWAYSSWKPDFYPADVPARRFLEHYTSRLNSVEVNYTFRKLPSAAMFANWLAVAPADFRFGFKAPQRITHFSRLRNCEDAVAEFVAALAPIREAGNLGPLLFQLPPNFKADPARLAHFLAAPAFHHAIPPMLAFEFRHESWFAEETYAVLRQHNAAMCIAETEEFRTPTIHCATTHACFRLRCSGGYTPPEIASFARKFREIATDREVYVYFKHEDEPTGALNAVALLNACRVRAGKR
jgi:uncharacterized protein YecE (DUF72 family)